jgi:anti-anti-sigma factor
VGLDQALRLCMKDAGSVVVIEVDGDLDIATSHLLIELGGVALIDGRALVVDLARLRVFAAAGVRALLQLRDAAAARATRLVLRNAGPVMHRVLTITDTADAFEIESTDVRDRTADGS